MAFCTKCGYSNAVNGKFCIKCGNAFPIYKSETIIKQSTPTIENSPNPVRAHGHDEENISNYHTDSDFYTEHREKRNLIPALITAGVLLGLVIWIVVSGSGSNDAKASEQKIEAGITLPVPNTTEPISDHQPSEETITDNLRSQSTEQPLFAPSWYSVTVPKAMFYNEADAKTMRSAYLVPGNEIFIQRKSGEFGYGSFTSPAGKTTAGWILLSELQRINSLAPAQEIKMSAYLIYEDGSLSSFNLIDNQSISLWNTIIGEGAAEKPSQKVLLQLEGESEATQLRVYQQDVLQGQQTFNLQGLQEFTITDTGCKVVRIELLKEGKVFMQKEILFECGE